LAEPFLNPSRAGWGSEKPVREPSNNLPTEATPATLTVKNLGINLNR
jgi:hypothetical protein